MFVARPAETAGAAGTIAILVGLIAGIHDSHTLAYIGAGIGLLPGVVTFIVTNGGMRGIVRAAWRGTSTPNRKKV